MNKIVKIFFLSAVFLSANSPLFSQTVTWQEWYDYNNLEDNGQDVIQTFDGGYAILSNSYSPYTTGVFKTDQYGNVEWKKLYDINFCCCLPESGWVIKKFA